MSNILAEEKQEEIIDIEHYKESENLVTDITEKDFNKLEQFGVIGEYMKKLVLSVMKVTNRFGQVEEKTISNEKKAEKALAINDTGQMYLNQTELGKLYKPSMSSHTIGNILRLIGWAKSSKTHNTEPYESIQKLRAKMLDFNYYRYHKEKFKDDFEGWLKDNNLYAEFDSHISRKQRQQFFKKLHEENIN